MPRFIVRGISRVTGENVEMPVDATDGEEAREVLSRNGIVAQEIEEARPCRPRGETGRPEGLEPWRSRDARPPGASRGGDGPGWRRP